MKNPKRYKDKKHLKLEIENTEVKEVKEGI